MKTEIKVLKFLLGNKKNCTIREISKGVKADYRIVHTAINRLFKKGVIGKISAGSSSLIFLNNFFSSEIFEAEFERRAEIIRNKNIGTMLHLVKERMNTANYILLLFGSYVKGKQNKHSDIDLMFIVPDEKIEKAVEHAVSFVPLKVHFHVFTEKEFSQSLLSTKFDVVKEAIKNNIILYGIEQYYELIKNG